MTIATVTGSLETMGKIEMEQRHDLYCSTNTLSVIKSTGMRWAGYVARIEGNRISDRGVMRIPEVKRLLGRLGLRWDDNIKMGFKENIFGPNRDEVTGEWRKLHNEEQKSLYSSPNILRVIKSRRMRWAGHVARMGEGRGVYRVWWGNPREETAGETKA
jgi:hypothetical protein